MNCSRKTTWLALALLLVGLLAGCGQSTLEIGMVETNLPGRWEASYATFTGTKVDTVRTESGQTLILDYSVEVDKGSLRIEVGPQEEDAVWEQSFQEDAADTLELSLEQEGVYTIAIEGDDTGGGFDLSWEVQ